MKEVSKYSSCACISGTY